LDSGLFIYAKDGGMIRRVKIKADNVGGLLLKVGVLAQHVAAQPVRLKAAASPNPRNCHVIGAKPGRQSTAAPLGGSILGHDGSTPICALRALLHQGALCAPDDGLQAQPDDLPKNVLSSAEHKKNYN
jgi:hypothetical protein